MARYIDADLPCVSDYPSRRELAAERDSEKYDEGYSDGKVAGYDEGHSDGRADMHAEVMTAIREMLEEHADDDDPDYTLADAISMVHDAVMAIADDAEVGHE